MRIEIVDYRPEWPAEFAEIAQRLRRIAGDGVQRIDHIGSTSVESLAAKDIIDIQITVGDLDESTFITRLESAGYRQREAAFDVLVGVDETGESGSRELRKRYFREPEGERRAHVHVREAGRLNQRYALLFRDYLRGNPSVRRAYELVKRRLSEVFAPDDVDGYYSIKDPFMDVIYLGAEQWALVTNWSANESSG